MSNYPIIGNRVKLHDSLSFLYLLTENNCMIIRVIVQFHRKKS